MKGAVVRPLFLSSWWGVKVSFSLDEVLFGVLAQYHRQHDLTQVPVKVDLLRPMMEERGFADRIIWEKYDFAVRNIAAQIAFFRGAMGVYAGAGDYARIQYSSGLNFCWERFVLCKEMYHCIIDNSIGNRVTNLADLMKLAEYLVDDTVSTLEPFSPHGTEQDAEILALETLFPLELRQTHQPDYDAGKITDHQLALRYRIPEQYARLAMYPNYNSVIKRIRTKLVIIT
ncbi:hypothetical protein [Sphingomonas sp. HMP6]|uniref:hypothetical protein n=1 Tax=Sphingomonas sp. HMP6 TaxID=1517551 RepID=UPI0015968CF4|nr:hypothetical protein [Sphingomonas sp. HMP6]